jgi:TonB family protein
MPLSMVHTTRFSPLSLLALTLVSCASSSATHPRSAADQVAAEREWAGRARDQIRDYWNPWDVVRTVKQAESPPGWPTTVLRIAVRPDGTASRPEVIRSSGVPALDDLAVKAVTSASPLPPPPDNSSGAGVVAFDLGFRVVGAEAANSLADDTHDAFPIISAACEEKPLGVADPLDVQKTIESYRRDVTICLDEQRGIGVEAVGEVTVEFVISDAGNVHRPVVLKTGGLTRSLERCLLRTMSRWTFHKPAGGAVKVAFPFHFLEGQAAGADVRRGVTGYGRADP